MKRTISLIVFSLALGLGLVLALLWEMDRGAAMTTHAPVAELRVCASGCAYTSVQAAVDAAQPSDVVKVAAGAYTGVNVRPRADLTTTGLVTQVVYVTKSITIQGGYTTTDWMTPDPHANVTTLDAEGEGRVFYVTGDISVTIEGLQVTGGDATGLGGGKPGRTGTKPGAGGGLYVLSATVTLKDNRVFENTVSPDPGWPMCFGAGAMLYRSHATLTGNTIVSNTSGFFGGGLYIEEGAASLSGNTINGNSAVYGGGLVIQDSQATVEKNTIASNFVWGGGGGLFMPYCDEVTLRGNTITGNTAGTPSAWGGGGLSLSDSNVRLEENVIADNYTTASGGGLYLDSHSDATLINNAIIRNDADDEGSGVFVQGSSPRLWHNTFSHNGGGIGFGLSIVQHSWDGTYSAVALTNTIIDSQPVGIGISGSNTVTVNGVLWHNSPITVSASVTAVVAVQNQHTGDPAFGPDGYHITPASAALNAGMDTMVNADIDGDARPDGCFADLGADEFITGIECERIYLPLVMRGD